LLQAIIPVVPGEDTEQHWRSGVCHWLGQCYPGIQGKAKHWQSKWRTIKRLNSGRKR